MENLDSEQIKKALECCANGGWCIREGCPLYKDDEFGDIEKCTSELSKNALALIKELTEENERLRAEVSVKRKLLDKAEVRIECVEEENNQLKADICNAEMNLHASCTELTQECKKWQGRLKIECEYTRADTVRKIQERLTKEFDRMHKNNFMTPEVRQWIIDQIAKRQGQIFY